MTREEYKDELRAGVTNYALTVKQAIDAAYKHADETNPNGWRPASELPKEKDVEVVMLVDVSSPQFTGAPLIRVPMFGRYINGWPEDVNVKWWCYPPKEE